MIDNIFLQEQALEENDQEPSRKRGGPAIVPLSSKIRRVHEASHMPIFVGMPNRCRLPSCD